MDASSPEVRVQPRLRMMHGIIFAVIAAITAELVLASVVPVSLPFSSFARMVIVFLTIYIVHRFALESLKNYRPKTKDILTLSSVMVGSILLAWLGRVLAIGLTTYAANSTYFAELSQETLLFAIPFAAGTLLLQAILGLHYGLVFTISFAIIIGLYAPEKPILVPYLLATGLTACLSLSRFRSRSAYIKAGFNIALIAFPFALAAVIIDGNQAPVDIMFQVAAVFLGGALCSFIAAGLTPVFETLGSYITDMRLIEMATIDHPLLKELSVQVPGTWNHSMVMGMMAEAAADEIGANAVLARVGAYFHDVGKTKKPAYFVENQSGGENRHDKLSTSMSALIIRSHVKDGIELAKKHKLPAAIIDMIPQHHGTSVIGYFYNKACKEAEEAGDDPNEVDISLYSYPGPKPQTREAGILMLADGIEAAARTINEPTLDRIQGMVQKMMNKVFASGQLSECDLTLRDLHLIAKSFTRILCSIYHQRIAYAEPAEKVKEKAAPKNEDGEDPATEEKTASKGSSDKNSKSADKNKANAKREEGVKDGAKSSTEKAVDSGSSNENGKSEAEAANDKKANKEDLKRLGLE